MQFPKSFFEDEVRDGFYVSSMIKRAWAAQLEILEDIDKVCKKHNLQYFAEWGTLLGAIRHGGFIPWDDDMDICMKREDYNKFSQVALQELPDGYGMLDFAHSDDGDFKCDDFLIRLYNGNRIRLDKPFLEKFHGFPYVAGIDIFPLDYMAPTEKEDEMLCEQMSVLSTMAQTIDAMDRKERREYLKQTEKIYGIKFDRNKPLRIQLYMLADKISGEYKEKDSQYLTAMALRSMKDYKVPKEYYADAIMVPFEHTQIPVPLGYDGVLKIKYGDYMKSVRDGGGHEYPFYKKQEAVVVEKRGSLFKNYQFSPEDLDEEENNMSTTLKSIATDMLGMLQQAHESIFTSFKEGNPDAVVELLEDCQEGAIVFGTKIEEIKGESPVISTLEQYCETLYHVHEAIVEGENFDGQASATMLLDSFSAVEKSVEKNILQRKIAVFLPYKASMWDSLESVWKAAEADPDCDAYVIPIPYYDKGIDGALGEMHYEGEQYPESVPVTDYKTFDFGTLRPDMIFIHNPYDEYNLATSVHPFFYSKNLKKFTDNLVYIPYFVLDEIEPSDERAVKSMEHFCTKPGVVKADTVIVQSEKMRQAYIRALVEFAGEESRPIWEKKILGLGSPKYDKVLEENANIVVPDDWKEILYKEDGTKKKVVLYNTGLGAMLEFDEAMIHKIENVLKTFSDNREEVALLWRPHPLMKATLQSMKPKLLEQYERLVAVYQEEGWGIYDDTADLDRAVKISDAYYGDSSSVIQLFRKLGKPVMVQDVNIL